MIEIAPICRSSQFFDLFPKCISINNNTIQDIVNSHLKTRVIKSLAQSDFHIRRKKKPLDELTNKEIGNLGEKASFRFLETFFSITSEHGNFKNGFKVEYLNKNSEQFKPYDIKVGDRYFDVKTTRHKQESHFHISMQEAEFITQNFDEYYFIRVFPLRPSETYIGIQIAHDLGANFYTFKHKHKQEFYNAYEEAKSLAQLDGFLVKAEWLYNVLYKNSSALVRCFDFSADSKLTYSKKMEYYSKFLLSDINLPDDIALNYRKARLVSALGMLYYKRDTIDFEVLLEQAYITEIINEWASPILQEFLTGFCRNCNLLTIKYFTMKVILLKEEKYLLREVSDAMQFNKGVSNPDKHEEFVEFIPYFLIFDRLEKGESYDSFAFFLESRKKFYDEEIEDILDKIYQYNIYDSRDKSNLRFLIGLIKSMGLFDIPLRMSSF